ncbi:translation initiation factor IF-2-like [Myotis myotis]|uniref:translation initiation factor IF-2-like n=1 Tax=Myotis myotis TaxID=51298 RepID=UPI00174BC4E3|nr:translation initiation factor IF-2-like [Myotis myotis]
MDQDTAFPLFKAPAQHWRFTYKPSTNKQRGSLAGEGEEEAGEGDVRSFPSQKLFCFCEVFEAVLDRRLETRLLPLSPAASRLLPASHRNARTHPAPAPGPPEASITVPESLFPPQTSHRPAPRPPRLAPAAAPSPSPPLPTCRAPGPRWDRRTSHRLAAGASQLSPRGPVRPRPTPRREGPRSAARLPVRQARGCAPRRRPALATHTPPKRPARPPPPPAFQELLGLRPASGRWAAARAPRCLRPPPGGFPSAPPHPDPPARRSLSYRLACRIRGAEGDDSARRSPPRPGPRSLQPSESSGSRRLGHQRRGQQERQVTSRRRRRRGHARAPVPAAYRLWLSEAAMTPRERERNRPGRSRLRRHCHRGRRRLRLPRDVSSAAHSPSSLSARQAGGRAGASTSNPPSGARAVGGATLWSRRA